MAHEINLGGTIYVSSRHAAEKTGYTQDYVGQLARSGAIVAQRISGMWYVLEESLLQYKEKADQYVPQPPQCITPVPESEVSVSFDGRDFVSAHRAAKLTGYKQDYVGQLAHSDQILSRQIGNRWYIERESLLQHKKEKDALLAAVQTEAVGLKRPDPEAESSVAQDRPVSIEYTSTHFTYVAEDAQVVPAVAEESAEEDPISAPAPENAAIEYEEASESDETNEIPIRVIAPEAPTDEEYDSYAAPVRSGGKKPTRSMTFFISGLTVLAALGTLAYVGDAMGYFDVSRMLPRGNQQEASAGASVVSQSSTVAKFFSDLFSKELVYHRH